MEGLLNHYHLTEAKIFSTGKAHQQQGPVFDTTSLPALMEKPAEAKKFLSEMRQQVTCTLSLPASVPSPAEAWTRVFKRLFFRILCLFM